MAKIPQKEYDQAIATIEENTCFRFTAGIDDSGAFFVPTSPDGTVIGDTFQLTWEGIKQLAALGPAPA